LALLAQTRPGRFAKEEKRRGGEEEKGRRGKGRKLGSASSDLVANIDNKKKEVSTNVVIFQNDKLMDLYG
jgi:hypothetical protein